MRSAVLLALLGLALAHNPWPKQIREEYFASGKEFHYRFDGHVSAGLAVPGEQAVTRIQTLVRIQPENDRYVRLELSETRFGTVQEETRKRMIAFETTEEVRVNKEFSRVLALPIRFAYRQGLVSDIEFSHDEQPWSANIKRAVLNMLQINLVKSGINEKRQDDWESNQENDFFVSTERTLEGECEVSYTKLQAKEQQQWTKSINFDKCSVRPQVVYGRRFTEQCPECDKHFSDEKMSSTLLTYNVTATSSYEKFMIHSVELESKHSLVPLNVNEQLISIRVWNKMELIYAGEITKEIPLIKGDRKETLVYSTEWELAEEMFAMTGEEKYLKKIPYMTNRVEILKKVISKLNQEIELESAHLIARVVKVLRLLTEEELNTMRRFVSEQPKKVQDMYIDCLALAGTKNTIAYLFERFNAKEISPLKAAQIMKTLVDIRTPSKQILKQLQGFCEAAREGYLRQSCWLTYGSILNEVCGNNADKFAMTLSNVENKKTCSRMEKNEYVHIIVEKLNHASSRYEKVLFVKALANAAIDTSIIELEQIIMDKKFETVVRVQAVEALRRLRNVTPKKIQNILVPLFKNTKEIPEIRMTSLTILLQTQPEQPVIDMIVRSMDSLRSQQVQSFTYTSLMNLKESTNPCEKDLGLRVAQALNSISEPLMNKFTSKAKSFYNFNKLSGSSWNLQALFSNDSVLPKELSATLDSVFGGEWNKYLVQFGLEQNNLDQVLTKIFEKVETEGIEKLLVRGKRSTFSYPRDVLENLIQNLKIRFRSVNPSEPHAMLYFRYKDMDYAFLPMDLDSLPEMMRRIMRHGEIDLAELENIFMGRVNTLTGAMYIHEYQRTFPSALGMPVVFTSKLPTVASLEGSIKVALEPKNADKITGIRFQLVAKPKVAGTHVLKAEIMTPVVSSGVKLLQGGRVRFGLESEVSIDWNKRVYVKNSWNLPQERNHIAHFEGRPVLFSRTWKAAATHYPEPKEKTLVIMEESSEHKYEREYFEASGVKLVVSGQYPKPFNFFRGENVMDLVLEPLRDAPKELITQFEIVAFQPFDIEKPTMFSNFFEKLESKKDNDFLGYVKGYKSDKAYKNKMMFKVEAHPKFTAMGDVSAICDEKMRFCRVKSDFNRSPIGEEKKEWSMKNLLEVVLPKENVMPLAAVLQSRWEENEIQLRLKQEDMEIEEYMIHGEYKLTQATKFQLEKFYALLKVWQWWSVEVTPQTREINYVQMRIALQPETREVFNVTLWTPKEIVELKDMPFFWPVQGGVSRVQGGVRSVQGGVRTPLKHTIEKHLEIRPECVVKSKEVKTFDGLLYKTPLTTCYSVLAKDCSEKPKFAVLMKKISEEKKMIKVISRKYEIVMEKSEVEMKMTVNGKEVEEKKWEEFGVTKVNEEMYKIDIEEVVVFFDGYKAEIKMSHMYKNKQCGLCGHFDGEKSNDFRRADNEETEDIEEFHRSYLAKDEECRVEEEELSKKSNYKVVEDKEYKSEEEEEAAQEPVMRTRVLERGHKVCFSTEPVATCPRKTTEEKITKKIVTFKCLRRSEPLAQRLIRIARKEVINDDVLFELDEVDYTTIENEIRVPRMCSVY